MLQPQPEKPTFVYDSRISAIHMLRVNVKSLAAEARIIRQESMRCGPVYRSMLANHRRGKLREESRYAQLALAFVRGKAYRQVEANAATAPSEQRLHDKIRRFASFHVCMNQQVVKEWLTAK